MIYLDNAATTKPSKKSIQAYVDVSYDFFGNPGTNLAARNKDIEIRTGFKNALKYNDDYEIIFTSGGTEANNLALLGYLDVYKDLGYHIVTSKFEHSSINEIFNNLEEHFVVDYINITKEGYIDIEEFKSKLTNKTLLVSFMHINNELGTVQPIEQLYKLTKEFNSDICFMLDTVQGVGKSSCLNIKPDLSTLSSHKIYGPKAVGALIKKKEIFLKKQICGGDKENNNRGGTQSLPAQAGFLVALEESLNNLDTNLEIFKTLRNHVYKLIDQTNYITLNAFSDSNVVSIHVKSNLTNGEIVHELRKKNIYLSTKSADNCDPLIFSRTLKAIGLSDEDCASTIRISLSHHNTTDELDKLFEELNNIK